ncbi:ribonuclease R [Peptoniphilus sp. AGMB00490]|uniref:Ribonuclease R n=1 Tax=Peptoniphilus faecalis TaxID=2731255 RepID=A0A848RLE4_9FIRM|nr:ribonuclease R [Peptoniphilus faecalis]NMW84964.1 ribonuclease R [Peptoniphilus faecalis]
MIKEKILEVIKNSKPRSKEELTKLFKIKNKEKKQFFKIVEELQREGLIFEDSRKKYRFVDNDKFFYGKLQTKAKGFGFLIRGNLDEDIYISKNNLNFALNDDEVIVRRYKDSSGDRPEGKVLVIVKRVNTKFVGVFQEKKDFGFVITDESKMAMDIYIPKKKINGARNGQKVVVKIEKWPEENKKPEGRIIEILGYPEDPHVDIMSVAASLDLPMEFNKAAISEAKSLPQEVSADEIKGRRDFRDLTTFTIDGADSKDFDDAISLEISKKGNYILGVHIADVAHYVQELGAIDEEAFKRGNSVYLLNKVIPMIPFELSNGICSLNEGVDRLTLSVIAEINKSGDVVKHEICESVINSNRRLVYEDVSDYLEKNIVHESLVGLEKTLDNMYELSQILQKKREEGGAIDFDIPEVIIEVDERGWPQNIHKRDRRSANKLIEDFMLTANVCVAREYFFKHIPFLYRIHERPKEDKISELNAYLRPLGYMINFDGKVEPKDVQKVLERAKGTKEEMFISTMTLRSMTKARYSEINDIHFGLAFDYYSHFTSPIRRYADLTIHRIIKRHLKGTLSKGIIKNLKLVLPEIAEQVSRTEKIAQDAERQVEDIKMAEYMSERIGERYIGRVSSITSFGIFVELENLIEGLISYRTMDGYYEFDVDNYKAIDYETKDEFHIGDEVKIEVINVDLNMGNIDFKLIGDED